jgi:MoaA/NifB/PqqE/SkfB family radical SAM enzyme
MEFGAFMRLVDEFAGVRELHLQGLGEPMMHPRFFDMVEYASGRGIQVSTNSNMTLLTPAKAERCVTSGLEWIHVSIDGATAEVYEKIRVQGKLKWVLRSLRLIHEARRALGSRLPHLRLVVVVMRQNLHELPALVRLAHRWGFESMFVQHLAHDFAEDGLPEHYRPMREFVEQQTLVEEDPDRVERYFGEARKLADRWHVDLRLPQTRPIPHAPSTPGPDRCNWPWTGAYISYQGLAMPCCMVATPDRASFGNMIEEGVNRVWNGEAYESFRGKLSSGEPPGICKSCAIYNGTF